MKLFVEIDVDQDSLREFPDKEKLSAFSMQGVISNISKKINEGKESDQIVYADKIIGSWDMVSENEPGVMEHLSYIREKPKGQDSVNVLFKGRERDTLNYLRQSFQVEDRVLIKKALKLLSEKVKEDLYEDGRYFENLPDL